MFSEKMSDNIMSEINVMIDQLNEKNRERNLIFQGLNDLFPLEYGTRFFYEDEQWCFSKAIYIVGSIIPRWSIYGSKGLGENKLIGEIGLYDIQNEIKVSSDEIYLGDIA